jgi:putative spermidine/putrescine transport system permease protein
VKWFNRNAKPYILIAPSLLFVLLFLGYGAFMAVVYSLENAQEDNQWSLINYEMLFQNQVFWDSLGLSVWITIISTLLSLLIGLIITRILYRYFLQIQWKVFVWIPMLLPHFVAGYMVVLFFAQSGWFSSLFYHLGVFLIGHSFPFWSQIHTVLESL